MTLLWLFFALLTAAACLWYAHRSHLTPGRAMTTLAAPFRDKPPMTGRAKAYLWITCLRTLPIALSCLLRPDLFAGKAFDYIEGVMPMWAWGGALLLQAAAGAAAALTQREWLARMALISSAALAMAWVIGFLVAYHQGNLLSPVGVMWGFGIAAKDLVVCRQPLWSPFEPLVQRVMRGERLAPTSPSRLPP